MRVTVALLLLTVVVTGARADSQAESRARAHYEIGLGFYKLHDYQSAIKEFAAGYELTRRPGFLLNLGQSYRMLGDRARARDRYRQFLAEAPSSDAARPQAEALLHQLDAELAAVPSSPATARPVPSAAAPPAAAPPAAAPSAAAPSAASLPAPSASARSDVPEPPASRAPAAASVETPARHAVHSRRRALRIAGATLGVAGLGLLGGGIGAAVSADQTATEINRINQMGGAFDPDRDASYSADRTVSGVLFGLGGAVTATGLVLLFVSLR